VKLITLEIIIAYGYMRMHDMWIKTLLIMDEVSKVIDGHVVKGW
jgi:ethanolamine utilization protein EutQ (cupin superfamily)